MARKESTYHSNNIFASAVALIALVIAVIALWLPIPNAEHTHPRDPALTAIINNTGESLVSASEAELITFKPSYFSGSKRAAAITLTSFTAPNTEQDINFAPGLATTLYHSPDFTYVNTDTVFNSLTYTGTKPLKFKFSMVLFVQGQQPEIHITFNFKVNDVIISSSDYFGYHPVTGGHNTVINGIHELNPNDVVSVSAELLTAAPVDIWVARANLTMFSLGP